MRFDVVLFSVLQNWHLSKEDLQYRLSKYRLLVEGDIAIISLASEHPPQLSQLRRRLSSDIPSGLPGNPRVHAAPGTALSNFIVPITCKLSTSVLKESSIKTIGWDESGLAP